MKNITILLFTGLLLTGCASKKAADAYGNFEAIEIIVSSEANGKLMNFNLTEGQSLHQREQVALIDTTVPALQKQEIEARRQSVLSRRASADAQIAVVRQQLENVQVDLQRVQNMVKDEAATQKQLDDLTGSEKILKKQLQAAEAQRSAVNAELEAIDANRALLNEQFVRCKVLNPVDGTVLEKYCEMYELTAVGKPLYKIANLNKLILRAYVSGNQLDRLKIGQDCTVRIDDRKKYIEYPGTITWISNNAEFTPKIIQTKETRVNLVYAVKILVNNDGTIKIGMPGEVVF